MFLSIIIFIDIVTLILEFICILVLSFIIFDSSILHIPIPLISLLITVTVTYLFISMFYFKLRCQVLCLCCLYQILFNSFIFILSHSSILIFVLILLFTFILFFISILLLLHFIFIHVHVHVILLSIMINLISPLELLLVEVIYWLLLLVISIFSILLANLIYSIKSQLHYLRHPTYLLFSLLHLEIQLDLNYIFICSIHVHLFYHPKTLINLHFPCSHILIHFNNHIQFDIFSSLTVSMIEMSYQKILSFPMIG